MAFGLSPKYNQDIALDDLSQEQFLLIALEAAKKLSWNVGYVSETGFTAYTGLSMSSFGEEIKVQVENGNASMKSECTGNQLVDWGKNKRNIESLVNAIDEVKSSVDLAELTLKYKEQPHVVSKEEDVLSEPAPATKEKLSGVLAIFKPAEGYFITPILINLNILIFILMVISGVNIFQPDTESLIKWGANFRPVTLGGEWWRLVTNCFLHIGILHLLLNMYALLYIGLLLEPRLGRTRFLSAYLLTGIAASVTSLWWHDLTVSAGASGAIFGMYGVFLAMLTTNLIEKSARQALLTSIGIFVAYNLINGMKGGIDNAAHIGGLICGLLIGYAYYQALKKPAEARIRYVTIAVPAVVILSLSLLVIKNIPNDLGKYEAKMKEFGSMEEKALGVYSLPSDTPKDKLLYAIKEKGIYYWSESIELLNGLEKLDLPPVIHARNQKLIHYCNQRIKAYSFIYKAVEQDIDIYADSINYYNREIETTINSLKEK